MGNARLSFARVAQRVQPLSNTARSGRYARGQVWRRHKELLRKIGWLMAACALVLTVLCATAASFLENELRGFVLGAGLVLIFGSLEWCVFMWSGSASSLSGAMAESSTATDLNRLKKRGWQVVHGLKLRVQSDIDHVAIGRGGVLVVETKWSAEPWPPNRDAKTFMSGRLHDAIAQTEKAVTHVMGTFGATTKRRGVTRGVLVLDGPAKEGHEPWAAYTVARTTVLRSADLDDWLLTLSDDVLSVDEVRELSKAVAVKDAELAQRDAELGTSVPPTLQQLYNRWLVAFPLTAALTFFVLAQMFFRMRWAGWALGIAVSVAAVVRLRRERRWRPFLLGHLVGQALISGVIVFFWIKWLVER